MFQSWNKILKESADSLAQTAAVTAAAAKAKLDEIQKQQQPQQQGTTEGDPGSTNPAPAVNQEDSSMRSLESVDLSDNSKEKAVAEPSSSGNVKSVNLMTEAGKMFDSLIYGQCTTCGVRFSYIVNYTHRCRICNQSFCSKCLEQSKFPIPNAILYNSHSHEKNEEGTTHSTEGNLAENTTTSVNQKEDKPRYLCKAKCMGYAIEYSMDLFTRNMNEKFYTIVLTYLQATGSGNQKYFDYFPLETIVSPEDTSYRQALRIAQVVEKVADFTGFTLTIKAMKYAYYSSELFNLLISSDIYLVLNPLIENLKQYGIDGPTAILNLYYLSCKHQLEHKQFRYQTSYYRRPPALPPKDGTSRRRPIHDTKKGVLSYDCPNEVVEYVSRYLSAAQWLYNSSLPAPHSSNEWSSWYLSRLVSRQKWTLLMCVNETTKLPNGNKCPAFALLARITSSEDREEEGEALGSNNPSKEAAHDAQGEKKEAILVVRGSASTMDWSINFQETLELFPYRYYSFEENEVKSVDGHAHSGFAQSVKTILNDFNLKCYLLTLFENGFDIRVVGHSLGAGVSVLLAAELRNIVMESIEARLTLSFPVTTPHFPHSAPHINSAPNNANVNNNNKAFFAKQYEAVHRISAVAFCSPAIISEKLADAFLKDRLLINVINGLDAIPRYNKKTMQILAEELKEFSPIANEWMEEDKMDLYDYALSAGKAADLRFLSTEEKRLERYYRLKTMKEGKKAKPPKPSRRGSDANANALVPANAGTSTSNNSNDGAVKEEGNAMQNSLNHALGIATKSIASTISSFQPKSKANEPDAPANTNTTATAPPLPSEDAGDGREISLIIQPSAPPLPSGSASVGSTSTANHQALVVAAASVPVTSTEDPELTLTVAPGPIVHIYEDVNGMKKAAIINHHHEFFSKIDLLIPTKLKNEHEIATYRSSINAVKHTLAYLKQQKETKQNKKSMQQKYDDESDEIVFQDVAHLFPMDVQKALLSRELPYLVHEHQEEGRRPRLQPILSRRGFDCPPDDAENIDEKDPDLVPTEQEEKEMKAMKESFFRKIYRSLPWSSGAAATKTATDQPTTNANSLELSTMSLSSSSVAKKDSKGEGDSKDNEEKVNVNVNWMPCCVCGIDVTWPYITHSDACRALATHNCSSCGQIVCTLCSPAGDELPGDGISQTYKLHDYRVALPWLGLYAPQRVCLHCYYDSSYPGLSTKMI